MNDITSEKLESRDKQKQKEIYLWFVSQRNFHCPSPSLLSWASAVLPPAPAIINTSPSFANSFSLRDKPLQQTLEDSFRPDSGKAWHRFRNSRAPPQWNCSSAEYSRNSSGQESRPTSRPPWSVGRPYDLGPVPALLVSSLKSRLGLDQIVSPQPTSTCRLLLGKDHAFSS